MGDLIRSQSSENSLGIVQINDNRNTIQFFKFTK